MLSFSLITHVQLQFGLTALHKACENEDVSIIKHLVAAGCNQVIDAQTTVSRIPLATKLIIPCTKLASRPFNL